MRASDQFRIKRLDVDEVKEILSIPDFIICRKTLSRESYRAFVTAGYLHARENILLSRSAVRWFRLFLFHDICNDDIEIEIYQYFFAILKRRKLSESVNLINKHLDNDRILF